MAAVGVIGFAPQIALRAAGHGEVGVEVDRTAAPAILSGNGAYHGAGVEHMVVEGEVVAGDVIHAEGLLSRPGFGAKIGGDIEQRLLVRLAGPVAFERGLQLAARADTGKSKGGDGDGHEPLPILLWRGFDRREQADVALGG